MEQINGAVVRIVNVSPTGGAIFRILLENTARTVRVVAPSKATQQAPTIGESWTIFGSYAHDRQYGLQFVAANAVRQVSSGPEIVSLLARHPSFAEFGVVVGKRLWRLLGRQVYSALNAGDYIAIARATGTGPAAAVRLIQAWRAHCEQIEVSTYFAAQGLPPRLAAKAIELWGPPTVEVISTNPYLLAPFMPWKQLDAIAMARFAITHDSPLRLIAACALSIDRYCLQHLSQLVQLSELRVSLKAKVGSSALTTRAIELSVASGAMFLKGTGKGTFAQSRGQHIVTDALLRRLSELAYRPSQQTDGALDESPVLDRNSLQHSPPEPTITRASVTVLSASAKEASGLLNKPCFARATHIYSSSSQKEAIGLPAGSNNSYLLGKVLLDDSARLAADECYVIHGADDIDVVTACKLVHALPELPTLFIVTAASERDGPPSPFINIAYAIPNVARIRSAFARTAVLPLTRNDGVKGIELHEKLLVPELRPSITVTAFEPTVNMDTRILSAYRRAAVTSTAIIVTTTVQAAKVYNDTLHKEQIEVREFERLATPLVQLAGSYVATIGDTIVCYRSDYKKGFLAGSTGKIIDVVLPNILLEGNPTDVIVAYAFVDTVGQVSLSLSDCLNFHLGYAVPIALDKWSCQAVRIVCVDNNAPPTTGQLQKWMSRTTVGLFFAGLETVTLNALLLKLQPMQFKVENSP
ncbi:helix-hairpin-helix domain-containing protein [Massilia brevitalea]|uniref:helix-hairpin-helix domain-containing protein n=1 Tax=Massilia brevitalea TaxID=442526 RepID=UPI002739AC1C